MSEDSNKIAKIRGLLESIESEIVKCKKILRGQT